MKNYVVLVTAEDTLDVEAESEEEAREKALDIAVSRSISIWDNSDAMVLTADEGE